MSNQNAPKNPPAKSNAQDPLQAPQMDASPERFLPDTPEHIEALGNEAPPAVAGTPAPNLKGAKKGRVFDADLAPGMVRVKLAAHSGWYHPDTQKYHAAGDVIDVTPAQKALLKANKLLQPRPMPDDDDDSDGTITTMDRSSLRR
jgi:hypothetical protein